MSKSDETGPNERTFELAHAFLLDCTCITPHIKMILMNHLDKGEFAPLAQCTSLASAERGLEAWLELRQVEALFKKNASFIDDKETTRAAARSFLQSEAQCLETNARLLHDLGNPSQVGVTPLVATQIQTMRRAIGHLLGDFDDFRVTLARRLRLTPGATSDRSRRRSLPFLKVSRRLRAPRGCWPLLGDVLRELGFDESIIQTKYVDVRENRVDFVDKNYKTKRTIAMEGTHSVPLQLAFDSFAKEQLRALWSVDLSDQTKGQQLARLGSIDGSYSTVDLERASDTVAYMLVQLLFPKPWAEYLSAIRSPGWSIADPVASAITGGCGSYEKFSSMGNGSTFCIETIVFAAACIAVNSTSFAVYGDDIALERGCCGPLLQLLQYLGFVPNAAKTFHWAFGTDFVPFRESCGADWHSGKRVTPFYLRKEPSSFGDFHLAVNGAVGVARPFGAVWHLCRSWVEDRCSHLVPANMDPRSGVHIDGPTAYKLKLVKCSRYRNDDGERCSDWVPYFWGLGTAETEIRRTQGLRPYLHWFLDGVHKAHSPELVKGAAETETTSYYPRNPWVRASLNWLKRMSTGIVRSPRITSLVTPGEDLAVMTRMVRVPYVPIAAPFYLYGWTDALTGLQLRCSRRLLEW